MVRTFFRGTLAWIRLFDLLLLALLMIAILGGVHYHGRLYFKHAADLRRASLILGILGYFFIPKAREGSFVLKFAKMIADKLSTSKFRKIALFCGFIVAIGLSLQRAFSMRVTLYDVGIFHQILWSLANGLGFHSTISGAGNFLLDHFSPSLALLTPIYWIAQCSPLILPVLHPLLLFGGGAAWIYLASNVKNTHEEFRQKLAAATTIFVLSFESLWANMKWGFHENSLAFFSLSWVFALILSDHSHFSKKAKLRKDGVIFLLFLIAAASKEILLLDVAIAFICWSFLSWRSGKSGGSHEKSSSKISSFVLLVCSVGLIFGFIVFEKIGHPPDKNYFNRYYSYLGSNLKDFFFNLFLSPLSVIRAVGAKDLVRYLFTVFLPWLFIPLFWIRKKSTQKIWLLTALPSFASAALATYAPLRKAEFHYVLELWPVLACLTIVYLGQRKSLKWAWAWALFGLFRLDYDPVADFREFRARSVESKMIREKLASLPPDAAISADELAGTWVSGRKWVMRWPETFLLPSQCPNYVVLRDQARNPETKVKLNELIERCGGPISESQPWVSGQWEVYDLNRPLSIPK